MQKHCLQHETMEPLKAMLDCEWTESALAPGGRKGFFQGPFTDVSLSKSHSVRVSKGVQSIRLY